MNNMFYGYSSIEKLNFSKLFLCVIISFFLVIIFLSFNTNIFSFSKAFLFLLFLLLYKNKRSSLSIWLGPWPHLGEVSFLKASFFNFIHQGLKGQHHKSALAPKKGEKHEVELENVTYALTGRGDKVLD